jgi:nucleotide-binding universal stress UspA family protein
MMMAAVESGSPVQQETSKMQPDDTRGTRVFLSAAVPDLLEPAKAYVQEMAGDNMVISIVPDDHFGTISEDAERAGSDLIVLAVPADEDGKIDLESAFARLSLDSTIPVMVLRMIRGKPVGFLTPRRLVVPLDGSSMAAQAVPLAARISSMTGLPVKFVMVIDPSRVIPAAFAYDPEAWGIISDLRQTAHWALRQAEDQLRDGGITVDSDLLFGPVNACLSEVIGDGDVVVMTTHGSGQSRRRKFGSVATRILASIPQPIILMRGTTQGDVIVNGYEACSWVEPLGTRPVPSSVRRDSPGFQPGDGVRAGR